ncbi:hypothetical protein K1T71_001194 [Dendrolimus kikuchii]|uniref:Uncharacterized protein n=1 Tax=Dendrolimus kikuchii TaxID=765133 RepID=A0ACC1DGY9_9NEOP|nr:hypothetical protein K1T71_001194 [Dendrolimus kikuchii]
MFVFKYLIVLCTVFFIRKSSSVVILNKCDIADSSCKIYVYRGLIQSVARGEPEKKIPAIDPLSLKNITISLPKNLQFTLVDVIGKGLKDCSFDDLKTDIDHRYTILNITCNIDFDGQFKFFVPNEVISELGGSGDGDEFSGKGKLKIEKMHFNFDFPFAVVKKNGEIYLQVRYHDGLGVWSRVNGTTQFSSDDLDLGDNFLNNKLIALLNEYSKEIEDSVVSMINLRMNEFYHAFCDWFFDSVPANNFITRDLTPYVN